MLLTPTNHDGVNGAWQQLALRAQAAAQLQLNPAIPAYRAAIVVCNDRRHLLRYVSPAKCVSGVGASLAGLILAWVSFPEHAIQGQVDPAIVHHLGIAFVPIVAAFGTTAIARLRSPLRAQEDYPPTELESVG